MPSWCTTTTWAVWPCTPRTSRRPGKHADAYMKGATAKKNSGQIRQAHDLAGTIALKEKRYEEALAHFGKANQQDPYVLYRTGKAYKGSGNEAKANETVPPGGKPQHAADAESRVRAGQGEEDEGLEK